MERNRHGYWMKRLVVAVLAVMLCIGLCGCSAFFDLLEDFAGDSENEERVPFPTDMTIIFEWGEIVTDPTETTQIEEIEPITGIVVGDPLNVRSGPGTNYKGVGSMDKGETVVIWELSLHGELPWGKTDAGWICLDYVKLDDPDALLVSDEVVGGMTMVDNIRVYSGPGEHYKYVGTEEQDVRVEIRGFCGRWVRIQRGWVPLEMIYVDGTEGPEEPINATVNVAAINVRGGPGTNYDLVDQVDKGETLKIYYQVVLDGKTWGCSDIGWVFMDYMNVVEDDSIIGEWYYIVQVGSREPEFAIVMVNYKANGSFRDDNAFYVPCLGEPDNSTDDYDRIFGNYTYDGSMIIREQKSYGSPYDKEPMDRGIVAYSATVSGGKLTVIEGGKKVVYTRGTMEDAAKEIIATYYDSDIFGSWYYFSEDAAGYYIEVVTYGQDAKVKYQSYRMNHGSNKAEKTGSATEDRYFFDGQKLYTGFDKALAYIEHGTLNVEMSGAYMPYTSGGLEEAVAAILRQNEQEDPAQNNDPAILGTWRDAKIDEETFRMHSECEWVFRSDGTFSYGSWGICDFIYNKETGELTLDTSAPGKGGQSGNGTYTYDGTKLVLNYSFLEHVGPCTEEYRVTIQGNKGTMGSMTIYKGTMEEVAARLFANVSQPETPTEPEQSAPEVLGTWYCIRGWGRNGEPGYIDPPYRIEVVTFHENGIVECQTYRLEAGAEAPVQDPESPWLSGGTYSYDNLANGMMGEYDVTIEDGVLCVGCAGAMEFYHRGGVNEAVNTIRQKTAS